MDIEQLKQYASSEWVIGPVVLVAWVVFLSFVKRSLYGRLRLLSKRTDTEIDDLLINSLNFPINFLVIFSGLAVMSRIMPLSGTADAYIGTAMKVVLVLAGIFFTDQIVMGFLVMRAKKSDAAGSAQGIIRGIVRALILVVGTLVMLDQLGVTITPLLASLGVGSLAVALALRDTLANLFAGIFMIFDKPVSVGQYIQLESGERGYVEDIGLRSTRIRTRRDMVIVIPNDRIINSIISNYSQPEKDFAYRIEMGVAYESDLEHVERVTMEVAGEVQEEVAGAVPGFEPFMRYHTFGADGIIFFVNLRVKGYETRRRTMHEFIKRVHRRYEQEGISIPFPQRTVHLSDTDRQLLTDISGKLSKD